MMNFKKIAALISAVSICSTNLISTSANAISLYFYPDNTTATGVRYEEIPEMSEMYAKYGNQVFKAVTELGIGDSEYLFYSGNGASPVNFYFDWYSSLTDEEVSALSSFLTENYPQITMNESGKTTSYDENGSPIVKTSYRLDYGEELSEDKQMEISISIFENTGLCVQFLSAADEMSGMSLIGDLDGDSAVNALDASLVLTYYSDSQTGNTEIYSDEEIADISLLGDYDGDGAVNALDASLVLKEYAETQTE